MIKRILFIVSIIFLTACSTGKTSSKTKVYKRYPESLSIDSLSQTNDSIAKSNIPLKDSCATLILNNGARVFIKNQEFFQDTIKFKSCDTTVIFPQVVANKEVNLVTQNQDTLFYNSSSQSELITEEQHFSEEEEMDIEYEERINADKHAKAFSIAVFTNVIGFILNPGLGLVLGLGGLAYLIYLLATKKHKKMSRKWKPFFWTGFAIYMAGVAFIGLLILIFTLLW